MMIKLILQFFFTKKLVSLEVNLFARLSFRVYPIDNNSLLKEPVFRSTMYVMNVC